MQAMLLQHLTSLRCWLTVGDVTPSGQVICTMGGSAAIPNDMSKQARFHIKNNSCQLSKAVTSAAQRKPLGTTLYVNLPTCRHQEMQRWPQRITDERQILCKQQNTWYAGGDWHLHIGMLA